MGSIEETLHEKALVKPPCVTVSNEKLNVGLMEPQRKMCPHLSSIEVLHVFTGFYQFENIYDGISLKKNKKQSCSAVGGLNPTKRKLPSFIEPLIYKSVF